MASFKEKLIEEKWGILSFVLVVLLFLCLDKCSDHRRAARQLARDTTDLKRQLRALYVDRELVCRQAIEEERARLAAREDSIRKVYAAVKAKIPKPIVLERPVIVYRDQPYPKDSGVVLAVPAYEKMIVYQDSLRAAVDSLLKKNEAMDISIGNMKSQVSLANLQTDQAKAAVDGLREQIADKEQEVKKAKRWGNIKMVAGVISGFFLGRL